MLYSIMVTVQVVVALSLIGLILLQHGKGADAGAAFGGGASGTVFGAKGSANFMSRATAGLAVAFFALSLTLAYLVNASNTSGGSVTSDLPAQTAQPATQSDNKTQNAQKQQPKANGSSTESQSTGSKPDSSGNIAAPPAAPSDDPASDQKAAGSGGSKSN